MGARRLALGHWPHYQMGAPVRKAPGIRTMIYGVGVTQGALTQDALRRAQRELRAAYAALREHLSQEPCGIRLESGSLNVADWVEPGPTGGVDISVRARQGNGDSSFVGLHVPLAPTRRALSLTTP